MDSEAGFPNPSSFLELLFGSRNRENLSAFLPFMSALANPQNSSTIDENSTNADRNSPRERLILINPWTQTILLIESSSRDGSNDSLGFDSWISDLLFNKEGQPPASKESMEAMQEVEIGEEGEKCVICLEEWEVRGVGKEMPCKHRFHGDCINKWLKIHGTCPVCRYKMPVEESDDRSSKSEDNQNSGRRRGVWMGFSFGNGSSSITNEEDDHTESSTESAADSSTPRSADLDMEE